ncbi:MAG: amino acid racemase, partial [Myxococcota bacterium]
RVFETLVASVRIPALHIADPTAEAVRAAGIERIGLLGTRFTMEQAFYRDRLAQHGLEVLVPPPAAREDVHRVIYDELCLGVVAPASRQRYQAIARELIARGAQGVILGCTEIGLLLGADDLAVPAFDTTALHADAAVRAALAPAG